MQLFQSEGNMLQSIQIKTQVPEVKSIFDGIFDGIVELQKLFWHIYHL